MWRKCDLHTHTTPNERDTGSFDAAKFVSDCVAAGLDIVAVTDHDHLERLGDVTDAASAGPLTVVPGVEVSTDRGHVLALAPGTDGQVVIADFCARVGVRPGSQVPLATMAQVVRDEQRKNGEPYGTSIVLIGSHVETAGSMLATQQALNVEAQIRAASQLQGLEVVDPQIREQWARSGVKQHPGQFTFLHGSDAHSLGEIGRRSTYIFLPEVNGISFRHALATPESSVRFDQPPLRPDIAIHSISFEGGFYGGVSFEFCERANAIIGPPNSGKSFLIDALRYAFGMRCPIQEIDRICESRLEQCLPQGATVRVRGIYLDDPFEIERTRGASQKPSPPFVPIIFSQNELSRRAMDPRPAITLLDMHCSAAAGHKTTLDRLAKALSVQFEQLLAKARRAQELASQVENTVDGLVITKRTIDELAGTEPAAKLATDVSRTKSWRDRVRREAAEWASTLELPDVPVLPRRPRLDTDRIGNEVFVNSEDLVAAGETFRKEVTDAAGRLREAVIAKLDAGEKRFGELEAESAAGLAKAGFKAGREVLDQLGTLRTRLVVLEEQAEELSKIEKDIDEGLASLEASLDAVDAARLALRDARKQTCREVNASMRTFFAKLEIDAETDHIDRLLEDAKVGTGLWAASMASIRASLDRVRLLHYAIRRAQGRVERLAPNEALEDQDAIVEAALQRDKASVLADIATTYPGDDLELARRGDPPVPFDRLTEGMRALAIKEISFAASALPVVTDQPEDAVPTQAVFESLVPTLRTQRAERQFIVASHDANIVVAGDIEQIWVLDPSNGAKSGTLFADEVRSAAIDLLEGGREAFEQRGRRYGSWR